MLLSDGLAKTNTWVPTFKKIITQLQTSPDLISGIGSTEDDIDKLLTLNIPKSIEPFLRILKVACLQNNEEFEQAIKQANLIEALDPAIPSTYYSRGASYAALEKWDAAIEQLTKYAEILGWDSDVYEPIAAAYLAKGDRAKAFELASKGIQDNANSWGCLATFAASAPEARWSEISQHIQATNNPEQAYEIIIDFVIEKKAYGAAKSIFSNLNKDFPNSELINYYTEVFEELDAETPNPGE